MRVGFCEGALSFRGTTRAIVNYCSALQEHNIQTAYIFHANRKNDISAGSLFLNQGTEIRPIEKKEEINDFNLDFLYHVSADYGESHKWLEKCKCTTFLHQIGFQKPESKFCDIFAYASHWQNYYFSGGNSNVLPYIIKEPSNSYDLIHGRETLGIPRDAIVLGRHGGQDTWNLSFVNTAIEDVIKQRKDIYFLFMNTPNFIDHPQVIFLKGTHVDKQVELFIRSCDAMLHARWEGETFGLACSEFLIRRKPIISWSGSRERNHIYLAENSSLMYNTYADLVSLLSTINHAQLTHTSNLIPINNLKKYYSKHAVTKTLLSLLNM